MTGGSVWVDKAVNRPGAVHIQSVSNRYSPGPFSITNTSHGDRTIALDRHGWDVVDDEAAWRRYQQAAMAQEYRDDEW